MTLHTELAIHRATDVHEVFDFCREMLGTPDHVKILDEESDVHLYSDNGSRQLRNSSEVELYASLCLRYGVDGPLRHVCHGGRCCENEEDLERVRNDPTDNGWAGSAVSFDTSYRFNKNGAGCGDLHAFYVVELGTWLSRRGLRWKWGNEFTGEWFDELAGVQELGDPRLGEVAQRGS